MIGIIKTDEDYQVAIARIEELMDFNPVPDSDEEKELELLSMLVDQYEDKMYPVEEPDPVDIIKFYMDQNGLKQADMVPYLGSKSKVSEVLNGKRPLSLSMIRKLHHGLKISANLLLKEPTRGLPEQEYAWGDYPFAEMVKRGYFGLLEQSLQEAKDYSEELLAKLFQVFGGTAPATVHYRKGDSNACKNSLLAWQAKIMQELKKTPPLPAFQPESVGKEFASTIAKLSFSEYGHRTAVEFLNKKGIHVVFLEHLPKTYLDGACFWGPDQRPVIGMTLRYERWDNFWFTLLHELGHAHLHLKDNNESFFDDIEEMGDATGREKEANEFARDSLISPVAWKMNRSSLMRSPKALAVRNFASRLNVHPGIVAGRIRWEKHNYRILTKECSAKDLRKQLMSR